MARRSSKGKESDTTDQHYLNRWISTDVGLRREYNTT